MTDATTGEGIQAAIEAAQLRAAANQYRLKLRQHQQRLRQIKSGDNRQR
jgi:hypothetical protein